MRGVEFHEDQAGWGLLFPRIRQTSEADQALQDVREWLGFDVSEGSDPYVYLNALEREEELIFERATY